MRHLALLAILALVPALAHAEIKPGGYLFLYAQIIGCGDTTFVVDYAEVPDDGEVAFLEGFEIRVTGRSEDEIASTLASMIGKETGHAPKTLSVRVVPSSDVQEIAAELSKLAYGVPRCAGPSDPQPLDPQHIQTLAEHRAQ